MLYSLKIKDTDFKVGLISGKEEMKKGLSGKPKLGKNKGLLFDFGKVDDVTMNMQGMLHPIDMIFIGPDRTVIEVKTMKPGNYAVTVKSTRFVLEVNAGEGKGLKGEPISCTVELAQAVGMVPCNKNNHEDKPAEKGEADIVKAEEGPVGDVFVEKEASKSNNIIVRVASSPSSDKELFKKGGTFKIYERDVKMRKEAMQVLDDTGKVLMNIMGGERIFSILHTEELVTLAKKIDLGQADPEELGKLMEKIVEKQNTQEPEYVD